MKEMLSKEEFVKYMTDYQAEADALTVLYKDFGIDMIEMPWFTSANNFEKLLSFIMRDEDDPKWGTYISWWCWEADFGRDEDMATLYNADDTVYKTILTAEDLYDFLVEKNFWREQNGERVDA